MTTAPGAGIPQTDLTASVATEREPWGWGALVGVIVLGLVLGLVCVALGGLAYGILIALQGGGAVPRGLRNLLAAAGIGWQPFLVAASSGLFYGGFFAGLWLVVRRFAGGSWASLGWRPAPWTAFAAVLPVYVVTMLAATAVLSMEAALLFHGRLDNPQQAIFSGVTSKGPGQFVLFWLVIAVLAPIVEETLFRGMLFQLLRRSLPLWAAMMISAAVFALAHGIPSLAPALFVFGVALALVFHYTRSLYCSIALHMLINTVAVYAGLAGR